MGYWEHYHYVIDILKSRTKISRFFRKHFCTLTYLPSFPLYSTRDLVRDYGLQIHQISGNRIGFLFVHEDQFQIHEGQFWHNPSVKKASKGWKKYFRNKPDVSVNVTRYKRNTVLEKIGPTAKSSRTIAQKLGILDQLPCILVICHHFSNAVYIKNLSDETPTEIVRFFDEFCSSFYDCNAKLLWALEQVENYLDDCVYTVKELLQTRDEIERNSRVLYRSNPC